MRARQQRRARIHATWLTNSFHLAFVSFHQDIRVCVKLLSSLTFAHPPMLSDLSLATTTTNPALKVCLLREISEQCEQSPRAGLILTSTAIDVLNLVHEDAPAPLTCLNVERAIGVENQSVTSIFQEELDRYNRLRAIPPHHVEKNFDPTESVPLPFYASERASGTRELTSGKRKCFARSRLEALSLRGLYKYERALEMA